MEEIIELTNINKSFRIRDDVERMVLKNITTKIIKGEWVAISGPSGSGKSTLLKLLFGSITPDSGNLKVSSTNIVYLPQHANLKDHLTILENLQEVSDNVDNIRSKIPMFGFNNFEVLSKYPINLSGGEKSRISLLRAILFQPEIMLIDEPTSSLDIKTTQSIVKVLQQINNNNITLVVISHSKFVNSFAKFEFAIENGELIKKK